MRKIVSLVFSSVLLLSGCASTPAPAQGGWFALKWMEKPGAQQPRQPVSEVDHTHFSMIASYDPDAKQGAEPFSQITAALQEGDVIAYRLGAWQARMKILTGDVSKIGYRLFKYGHLAVVVSDPHNPQALRIFSSESFRGVNLRETLSSLEDHHFDVYRLDQSERMNRQRLSEFVQISTQKAGRLWGYDFTGMFGLWNSNLKPKTVDEVGSSYICSTVVATAFYYAGVDLQSSNRAGILDLVTPLQVVESRGHFIEPRELSLEVLVSNDSAPQ